MTTREAVGAAVVLFVIVTPVFFEIVDPSHRISRAVKDRWHAYGVHETAGNRLVDEIAGDVMAWYPKSFPGSAQRYAAFWSSEATTAAVRRALEHRGVRADRTYDDTAVFHLRCSDVGEYNPVALVQYASRAAEQITAASAHAIRVSWCGGHHGGGEVGVPPGHCQAMAGLVSAALTNGTGLPAPIECWPLAKTWDRFYGSKLLISTTGSFGFAVGVAHPDRFVFPFPRPEDLQGQERVPWHTIDPGPGNLFMPGKGAL